MFRASILCILFGVVYICVVPIASNYTTAGYGDTFLEKENETELSTEASEDEVADQGNLTTLLKMATVCETPNREPAYCVEIKQCEVLLKQLNNSRAKKFLEESKCGPRNEDFTNPKVCCGKYGNFRNVSTHVIVDDLKIFPKTCGTQRVITRGRIIGGKEASLGEYPWMARLLHKNKYGLKSYGCSGFLIHTKYVITAAHCTHPDLTQIRGPVYSVVLGEHNTETMTDCSLGGLFCAEPRQISRVEKVITHEGYNPQSVGHYNDIALIHLKKGARLSTFVQPICLPKVGESLSPTYYLSGWGKTENRSSSPVKMKVSLPGVDKIQCEDKYSLLRIPLRDTQICAGGEEGKDSCTGDSGGPLMMPSANGTFYATGIVSYGIGCGIEGWPGVYTKLEKFLPWIRTQILQNSLVSTKSNKKKKRKNHKKKNKTVKTTSSS